MGNVPSQHQYDADVGQRHATNAVISDGGASALSRFKFLTFVSLALLGIALLTGLGVWQVQRRTWKLALIEQVDQRVHAALTPAPIPAEWPEITATKDAYRHIELRGVFLNDRAVFVQASTVHGSGFWVVTPLQTNQGFTVLVNRGFVPVAARSAIQPMTGDIFITGLLRTTEPIGRWPIKNDPAARRWVSVDIEAIASALSLPNVAPYYVDADAAANAEGMPVGGMTVIAFSNSHLVYALTWFGLALMLAVGLVIAIRADRHENSKKS